MITTLLLALLAASRPGDPRPGGADNAALVRWDDSLRAASSPALLQAWDALSRQAPGAGGLRRALFLVRRGEVRHERGDLDQVIYELAFVQSGGDRSAWWPYVGARAYAAMELNHWIPLKPDGIRTQDESFGDAAWHELRIALDHDPDFTAARRLFLDLAVAAGDRTLRDDQLEPLEREVTRRVPDPDALLVWARHLRAQRLYDSALAIFDRSASSGGDRSRLSLERARTLRALHDTVAARNAWWDGLEHLTPTGRELYRYDLAWLISADSLAIFDRMPDARLAAWMHRFWDERDAAAANKPGERLDEHLRRWDVVYARYRVRSPWRRIARDQIDMFFDNNDCVHRDASLYGLLWKMPPHHDGDIRDRELLLDHRGIMYLRHGEPLEVVGGWSRRLGREDFTHGPRADLPDSSNTWSPWDLGAIVATFFVGTRNQVEAHGGGRGGTPYQLSATGGESWLYLVDGERVVLDFRPSYAIGMYDATTLSSYLPFSPYTWASRSGLLPEFHAAALRVKNELEHLPLSVPLARLKPTCFSEVQTAIARSRADADTATHNDSDSPPLVYPYAATTQMFALGAEQEHDSRVLVTFALGGRALQGDTLTDGSVMYPIHFRVVAFERNSDATITLDTVRQFVGRRALPLTDRLTAWFELPLPAGEWQIAAKATQRHDSAGTFAIRRDVRVDDGSTLALSDVVTGLIGSPWWIATDDRAFPVNVLDSWPAGSAVELYYEVHGLAPGTAYRATVEVAPVNPKASKGKNNLRIQSSDLASGPLTVVRRSLGVEQLAPGRYRLTVTVESGIKKVSRSQQIELERRE